MKTHVNRRSWMLDRPVVLSRIRGDIARSGRQVAFSLPAADRSGILTVVIFGIIALRTRLYACRLGLSAWSDRRRKQ